MMMMMMMSVLIDSPPSPGIHYCVNMVLIAVSTILSVVIINIGQARDDDTAPRWLMTVSKDLEYPVWPLQYF